MRYELADCEHGPLPHLGRWLKLPLQRRFTAPQHIC